MKRFEIAGGGEKLVSYQINATFEGPVTCGLGSILLSAFDPFVASMI